MKLYRYYEVDYGEYATDIKVKCEEFNVRRTTPKGYWIRSPHAYRGGERWVSNYSKKRYAYPTKKEALISFIARKRRQIGILSYQLEKATVAKTEAVKLREEVESEARRHTEAADR